MFSKKTKRMKGEEVKENLKISCRILMDKHNIKRKFCWIENVTKFKNKERVISEIQFRFKNQWNFARLETLSFVSFQYLKLKSYFCLRGWGHQIKVTSSDLTLGETFSRHFFCQHQQLDAFFDSEFFSLLY